MPFNELLIATLVLLLGIPLGNWLAKITKDELKEGQRWFKLIVILSLSGMGIGLIMGNDVLLFSFAFIAIVTSRSLKNKKVNSPKHSRVKGKIKSKKKT